MSAAGVIMVNVCVNWCERSCLIDGYGCGSKGCIRVGLHYISETLVWKSGHLIFLHVTPKFQSRIEYTKGRGVCFSPKYKILYIRYTPYKNMPFNNANILTYNFNFHPQHHYPINLSLKAIPSRI